jgi:bacterioferritin (cytochrome b1)
MILINDAMLKVLHQKFMIGKQPNFSSLSQRVDRLFFNELKVADKVFECLLYFDGAR